MERYFLGGIILTILIAFLIVLFVPNVISTVPGEITEGRAQIQDVDVSVNKVPGETVNLKTITRLRHRGGVSKNLSVMIRATSLNGILQTTKTKEVKEIQGDREIKVINNISVKREGGYRIDAILYKQGERIDIEPKRVDGVGRLNPNFATSTVDFHRFQNHPPIEYSIDQVSGKTVNLKVTTYLTNKGNETRDLELVLKARQSDSNILADEKRIQIGTLNRGKTAKPTTTLEVVDGYNYYLDAVLWNGNSIIAEERSVANLNPTETIKANETVREVGIEVSDFEQTTDERERLQQTQQLSGQQEQPGFGVGATIMAIFILIVSIIARKNE